MQTRSFEYRGKPYLLPRAVIHADLHRRHPTMLRRPLLDVLRVIEAMRRGL